jgi:chromosome segregation ATPase
MKHLQKLYDEVAPEFNKISSKRNEVQLRIRKLEKEMQEAEENYDVDKMEKLTTQLSSAKRVYERIVSDLDEHKKELNGKLETTLSGRIRKAAYNDFQEKNDTEEIQSRLIKINELIKQAGAIEKELQQEAYAEHLELSKVAEKFRPFLAGLGSNASLTTFRNYHLVEDNKSVK